MNKALLLIGLVLLLVGIIDYAINAAGSAGTGIVQQAFNSTPYHTQIPNTWTGLMSLDVVLVLIGVVLIIVQFFM